MNSNLFAGIVIFQTPHRTFILNDAERVIDVPTEFVVQPAYIKPELIPTFDRLTRILELKYKPHESTKSNEAKTKGVTSQ